MKKEYNIKMVVRDTYYSGYFAVHIQCDKKLSKIKFRAVDEMDAYKQGVLTVKNWEKRDKALEHRAERRRWRNEVVRHERRGS